MTTFQAIIIAISLMVAGIVIGKAQQLSPSAINGCVYLATPPSLTDRQSTVFTCDNTGKLRVTTS